MFLKTALAALALTGTTLVVAQDSSSSSSASDTGGAAPGTTTPTDSAPAAGSTSAPAGPSITPLASQHFTYTNLPYQADPNVGERGSQVGYNICNSTTQNQQSMCQTAIINSLDDFCLWGPPEPNGLIGNIEGEAVAWCTKSGHGTRVIPAGALTGVQFMRTPDYVQVTGLINQAYIDLDPNDDGGELDPHGADQRGNPLGGLVFSNAFAASGGNPNTYIQVVEWHNFMGGNAFCLKACDPAGANAARYCEHIYDRIGCQYNAPAAYAPNVFESCLGDSQDYPGVYTGADGHVSTYQQPPESLGPITSIPYTARIPASSQCSPGVSSVLYAGAPSTSISTSATRTFTTTHATPAATTQTTTTSRSGAVAGVSIHAGWVVSAAAAVFAAATLF